MAPRRIAPETEVARTEMRLAIEELMDPYRTAPTTTLSDLPADCLVQIFKLSFPISARSNFRQRQVTKQRLNSLRCLHSNIAEAVDMMPSVYRQFVTGRLMGDSKGAVTMALSGRPGGQRHIHVRHVQSLPVLMQRYEFTRRFIVDCERIDDQLLGALAELNLQSVRSFVIRRPPTEIDVQNARTLLGLLERLSGCFYYDLGTLGSRLGNDVVEYMAKEFSMKESSYDLDDRKVERRLARYHTYRHHSGKQNRHLRVRCTRERQCKAGAFASLLLKRYRRATEKDATLAKLATEIGFSLTKSALNFWVIAEEPIREVCKMHAEFEAVVSCVFDDFKNLRLDPAHVQRDLTDYMFEIHDSYKWENPTLLSE